MRRITPFLWFDNNAEEAMNYYVTVFKNSKVHRVVRYGEAGPGPAGTVMTVEFELDGQEFVGLNGGPQFKFTEAVSFTVRCETQEEVDYYWDKLSDGGQKSRCGWVKDKFGLWWQVDRDRQDRHKLCEEGGRCLNIAEWSFEAERRDPTWYHAEYEGR